MAWSNWSGNITFHPKRVVRPSTIADLQETIKASQHVKVVGSRHSFNSIAAPEDTWISLTNLEFPIKFNSEQMTVEFPGSMTVRNANKALRQFGVAIPSLGEIDRQTLAGVVATSTHGTGLAWGTLSDTVRGMRLVTGTGELLDLKDGDEYLAAARNHLGALGAVVSVTMDVVPAHRLERNMRFMPIDVATDTDFIRSNAHTQLFYIPFADKMYVKTLNFTDKPSAGGVAKALNSVFNENVFLDLAVRAVALAPTNVPAFMNTMAKQLKTVNDVGPSDEMMINLRMMKYHEMELAMDLEHTAEALNEVKAVIEEMAARHKYFVHLPVVLRTVKGCPENWLSPTLGRDTVYLSVVSHPSFGKFETYFKAVEERLVSRFKARPHWAKHFFIHPTSNYSAWGQFLSVRDKLDPQCKFLNGYLRSLMAGK